MKNKFYKISDEFWQIVEPLVPEKKRSVRKKYKRGAGGGRKPIDNRKIFCGILYVLKTGCQWKAVPPEFGASSSIHRYFVFWKQKGFFDKLWKSGLVAYDEMKNIAFEPQIIDASHHKAIRTKEDSGKSPVDRGKKWKQIAHSNRCVWNPTRGCDNFRIGS